MKIHQMLPWAKNYLEMGWSVVPVSLETKRPSIKWKQYQDDIPSIDDVERWFGNSTNKDIGIGVIVGEVSNLIVLDSDYKGDNYIGLNQINYQLGIKTPLRVRSGGGGHHLYYQYGVDVNHEVIKPFPKKNGAIEIRGNKCFMALPPTLHKSGNLYEWDFDLDTVTESYYKTPILDEDDISGWINKFGTTFSKNKKGGKVNLEGLDKIWLGVGSRYELMRSVCGLMITMKRPPTEAFVMLKIINERCNPMKTDGEIKELISSFYEYYNE